MNLEELQSLADRLRGEISKAVYGQDETIDMLLTGVFARVRSLQLRRIGRFDAVADREAIQPEMQYDLAALQLQRFDSSMS